jgi:tyrosyl-tRNA synthetase
MAMFWSEKSQKIDTDEKKIDELLTRDAEEVFIKEHLKQALMSGKQLRIKLGIDPTGPAIHLGRAITLRKLKAFQDLGHKAVLIIGDFTAKIADPSDKLEKRPMLTDEDIKENLKDYLRQIEKIVDLSKTEVRYNSEWLSGMNAVQLGELLENFTVQQMTKRRNFAERIEGGSDVYVVELIYPALQGYDSLAVDADVELGGFDQLFNLKAGRVVQRRYGKKEQDVMTLNMLLGTDGRKMSSSWGNVISLIDSQDEMFGKVMSLKDDLIIDYFKLCTSLSYEQISNYEEEIKSGRNPKEIKTKLAKEIIKIYHGENEAKKAEENFINTFSKGGLPENLEEISVTGQKKLVDVFLSKEIVSSKSEFRRLVDEGAINILDSNKKIKNYDALVETGTYKVGKRRFIKIKIGKE